MEIEMVSRRKEGPVIIPEQTPLEPAHRKKWENTLIGRVLETSGLKSIKPCHVIRDINKAWTDHSISNFKIKELGRGMFIFHFEDEKDMNWAMDWRPWLVTDEYCDRYLMMLAEWCPNTPPFEIPFSGYYPFWIQVHGIPLEYVSREMGKKIGEATCHEVLDVDFDETDSSSMKYLRVQVSVHVDKKLATGCWLVIDKNQPKKVLWVSFKYEELPTICYVCGIIGHARPRPRLNCWEDDKAKDAIAVSYDSEGVCTASELPEVLVEGQVLRVEGEQGYGPWLYQDIDRDDYDEYYIIGSDEEESGSSDEDYEDLVDVEVVNVSDEEMETEEDKEVLNGGQQA